MKKIELFNEKLKSIPLLRKIGKKINIYKAFFLDANEFSKYYVEEAATNNDYRYAIMLLVHSLEKGMCMPELRPFGAGKVRELMKYLEAIEVQNPDCFEYKLGVSVLDSWLKFYNAHEWTQKDAYQDVKDFISKRKISNIKAGYKVYNGFCGDLSEEYGSVVFSRHSVRDFKECKLKLEDIQFAIDCFIETPTACNRQMCELIYVKDNKIKKLLDKRVIGLPGFNKDNTQYFIVTYDLAAFAYSGERLQGLFNAGLCTTNFINGLHAKGIGSCCLQWSNKFSEDMEMRKALDLRKSVRIAIVIGCGYYMETNIIPCSTRKTQKEIFKIV